MTRFLSRMLPYVDLPLLYADGDNIGVSNSQHAVDRNTGNRSYATTGYYVPNKDRTNLLVLSNATVCNHHYVALIR